MDMRHPLSDFDCMMLDWAAACEMPVHILLTKADKLKRMAQGKQLQQVHRELEQFEGEVSVQAYSSLKRQGIDILAGVLGEWLGLASP